MCRRTGRSSDTARTSRPRASVRTSHKLAVDPGHCQWPSAGVMQIKANHLQLNQALHSFRADLSIHTRLLPLLTNPAPFCVNLRNFCRSHRFREGEPPCEPRFPLGNSAKRPGRTSASSVESSLALPFRGAWQKLQHLMRLVTLVHCGAGRTAHLHPGFCATSHAGLDAACGARCRGRLPRNFADRGVA